MFFRFVMFVLVVGGVACALNKRLVSFGGRGPKNHLLVTHPQNAAREHFVGNFFVHCGYTLLLLFLTSHFHSHITILKLCHVKKKDLYLIQLLSLITPSPPHIFTIYPHCDGYKI